MEGKLIDNGWQTLCILAKLGTIFFGLYPLYFAIAQATLAYTHRFFNRFYAGFDALITAGFGFLFY
ncbi:hypothetical protein [Rosenbergiella australiborealis]|uniref:hypothetical protein n=1 Tax=Rosenbergiella australiborealis TaxID=1544696 RepID=UPI001F4F0F2A|nr:hypothetical protein [Rosenbergiella australiborealis]